MALYIIGDYIREIRDRKDYTQEDVCFGICTAATLSRIENGHQRPGRYILDKLMERLGVENSFFDMYVNCDEMELYELLQEVAKDIADGKVEELELRTQRLEELVKDPSGIEGQFLYYAKGEIARKRGASEEEVMDWLMRAIHITLPKFDGENPLENKLLTFDEIIIINNIAMKHARTGNLGTALRLGFWLKKYMEEKMVDSKQKTAKYPVILFNLTNWLGVKNRFEDALKISLEGIDFCIKNGNLIMLPRLLFNKACALAELGQREDAKASLHQAVVIFETIRMDDTAQTITNWCKEHYQIEL